MSRLVIAIDGPAGAGKSTVAKLLAERLGLRYLDTGAMYRAVALKASRIGLGPEDGPQIAAMCRLTRIGFAEGAGSGAQRVLLDGEDVSEAIRTPEMGELASALSVHSEIRALLVERQKQIVSEGGCTLEGRDTTTVVAPDADIRVFLTASLEERARRRHKELAERGVQITLESLTQQIAERDHRDYTREDSPLKLGDGAIVVESFGIPPEVVVDKIIAHLPPS